MASIAQPRVQAPTLPRPRPKAEESGLWSWLTTVDHKRIAKLYGVSAFIFFLLGGLEALLIRAQLTRPENDVVDAQRYNELFTMHGTTMIFLVVMPLSVAFFNLVVPLQIGARDVAFPRLNAFSYWTFLAGAIVLNIPVLFSLPGIFARIFAGALNSLLGLPFSERSAALARRPLAPCHSRSRPGLVRLRAADLEPLLGPGDRLLGARSADPRRRLDGRRLQLHRHHHQPARPGHDDDAHADLLLDDPDHLDSDRLGLPGHHHRPGAADLRPASGARSSTRRST